jgi:hypothetical protein
MLNNVITKEVLQESGYYFHSMSSRPILLKQQYNLFFASTAETKELNNFSQ